MKTTADTPVTEPQEKTARIPDRHIQKLAIAMGSAEEAISAAEEAKRVAQEKAVEARRATMARAHVMELVYEIVGAPDVAQVDLQAGVLRWKEEPGAPGAPGVGEEPALAGVADGAGVGDAAEAK